MKYLFLLLLGLSGGEIAKNTEIAAAREGAPNHISYNASVMVWEKGRYVRKIKGTNEFTCLVWADNRGTFEPSCLNAAAMKAVLPVYEFQRQKLAEGISISDIYEAIASKAARGEFPLPEPGAVVYMMSERNMYFNHFLSKLDRVEPHIMLYYPKLKESSLAFDGKEGLPGFYTEFPHLSVVHIHVESNHQPENNH